MGKILAAYGGGFKPPTKGHFEIVETALKEFPEIDEFTIFVGSKVRDSIGQIESILVWDIYKKYLANKVKIEPVNSPIGDIFRLAKNNPQDTIYFIIGFREGRQDDLDDISNRTDNIQEKYPNILVKKISTLNPNISGTNARKALNTSEEEFIKYIPNKISEKSEIYNILRPSVMENLKENASYSNVIDYKQMIDDLTSYMVEKGRNIEPLPKVEYVDGDIDNAKDFLGKTAYYDPNTQTIVLYTEGRHPKDIVRSYSHEMVHHTQNLEDRLEGIEGTDTTADENLDKIEQEANLVGTMTFRNWTDSINEDKDYFGLDALIKEIIEEPKYKIFSDMDGVLTDFNNRFKKYSNGMMPSVYEKKYGKDKFWELIDGEGVAFWVGMPWMGDGKQYWDYIKNYDVELLSSPSRSSTSRLGKRLWVRNNMSGVKLTLAQASKKQNYAAPNHILIDDRKSNIDQWIASGGIGILHTSSSDTISQLKKLGL